MTNALERVHQGDLYALLSLSTKEELAPLVERVLSKLSNFLDSNDEYKKFQPDHTKYYKIIGDEIRLFGGNSVRNLMRRGEGPPYAEIVIDVCKKLDVPYQDEDTVKNESNLLDIFVERRWRSLSPAERDQLAEAASESALGKISDAATLAKTGATFVLTRALFGPAGWASLGISLLDAAYKVTVPCVLHIAYLRRKVLEEGRGTQPSQGNAVLALAAPDTSSVVEYSNSLVIRGDDGEPVLSLARIEEPSGGNWQEIGGSGDGISRLNPLLQLVPALATAKEVAGTNYMEVVTNGDRLLRTKDGILKAITVGPDGKFSGIAEVIEPSRLSAIVNTSALWNVASVALAQKHLADISKKLSDIKNAVDDIRRFQKDERHSLLTGSIRYFEQVAPSVLAGELSDRVLHQIERHEGDLLRVQDHLAEEILTHTDGIQTLKDGETFGSAEITQSIESHQRVLDSLYREMLLCIRARACGWQLLCIFPGDEIGKKHRRQDIQKALDKLQETDDLLTRADKLLRDKIHSVSSFWNKESTVNERKLSLLRSTETLLQNVTIARGEIQRDLNGADSMLAAMQRPVTMTVRIEEGRISALRAL